MEAGYHVAEVKAGKLSALDCGTNPESEIFIQLWVVNEGGRGHMPSGKLVAIIRKVTEHVGLDPEAKLTFEVSDGVAPMQLHKAGMSVLADGPKLGDPIDAEEIRDAIRTQGLAQSASGSTC